MTEKVTMREQIRRELAGLDANTVRAHSALAWEQLTGLDEFVAAKCVCVYVSIGHEIETHGLIRQLLALGRQVGAPALREEYVPVVIQNFDTDLIAGQSGILEPKPGLPACQPEAWLVPGLGFDRNGNRLGRGKGIYDRMLRETSGTKIALAHDLQVRPSIPALPHDVRMDFVVTEKQVLNCRERS